MGQIVGKRSAIVPAMPSRSRYRIVSIGSSHTGWGLEVDGIIRRTSPTALELAAYLDAIMAGASETDADYIARAVRARPSPTYEERMAVFTPTGQPAPSRDPFKKG